MTFKSLVLFLDMSSYKIKKEGNIKQFRNEFFKIPLNKILLDEMWEYLFTKNTERLLCCYSQYKMLNSTKNCDIDLYVIK